MLVDLHSHILPGVDDGSGDAEQSLAMLEIAEHDDIGVIAATPHSALVDASTIASRVIDLRSLAHDRGLAIQIVTGCEVRFDADLGDRFQAGELVTFNDTPWLLLELSLRAEWSPYLRQGIYDLQVAGAWPILAHAERYPAVQRDPDLLTELISQGVLMQVNADSILGRGSQSAARCADVLLRRRMVHLVASDAHDTVHRPPRVNSALSRARDVTDAAYGDWLTSTPSRVLAGEQIHAPDPVAGPSRGRLRRLFSRS